MTSMQFPRMACALVALAVGVFNAGEVAASPAASDGGAGKLAIAVLDTAPDNLAMRAPDYAKRIGGKLAKEVVRMDLRFGDRLVLHAATGRSYGGKPEGWQRDVTFAFRGAKPADAPAHLEALVNKAGEVPVHADSGLLWTLEELAMEVDCSVGEVELFVLTNGVALTRMAGGSVTMDAPPGRPFEGCARITFLGVAADGSGLPEDGQRAMDDLFLKLGLSLGFQDAKVIR